MGVGRCCRVVGKRAFTLIELLVVVSIIALLVSILLPSLSKAREQAKKVLCQNNLKQINIAMVMYAYDHRDYFPLCGDVGNYGSPITADWIYLWWPEALAKYLGMEPGAQKIGMTRVPDYRYEENWGRDCVYFCPSDKRTGWGRNPSEPPGELPPWTSYGMNEFSTWWHPDYGWGGNRIDQWYRNGRPVASTHMLLTETDGRSLREEDVCINALAPRHSWTMNILYVDGHIEWVAGPNQDELFWFWWGTHGGSSSVPPYMEIGQYWLPHSWVLGR